MLTRSPPSTIITVEGKNKNTIGSISHMNNCSLTLSFPSDTFGAYWREGPELYQALISDRPSWCALIIPYKEKAKMRVQYTPYVYVFHISLCPHFCVVFNVIFIWSKLTCRHEQCVKKSSQSLFFSELNSVTLWAQGHIHEHMHGINSKYRHWTLIV